MTEQIETDFWAAERARDTAERGRQADPSACGTCRAAVEAGGHAVHDGCAQRATLLPAPDAPGYELITGLSEEELAQLPARFHTPVFLDTATPRSWVCAVCWGEGWVTGWPCKTATKHGAKVFTPEHQAETAAKRQTAELEQLRARVAELEAELKRYVGKEPTIADEMAYLSRCLDSVHDLCDRAGAKGIVSGGMFTVDAVREAADGDRKNDPNRPALPWAHVMPDDDLGLFLDDLVSAAMDRWRSDPEVPDREVLANVEKACAAWRTPGQGYRSDEPEAGENR